MSNAGTDLYWIGATDSETGIWIWSYDYVPLTYSNWNTGEPNNHRDQGENCCHIMFDNGKWNDIMCSRKARFVCKRPMVSYENKQIAICHFSPHSPFICMCVCSRL